MFRCSLIVFNLLLASAGVKAQSQDDFLYVSGAAETMDEAIIDAKKQLALNLYSEIEVLEKSLITKKDSQVSSSFEQESSVRSLPLEIPNLELVSSDCQARLCDYRFKINRQKWAEKLSRDLTNDYELAQLKLQNLGNRWADFKRFSEANDIVRRNEANIKLLSSLNSTKSSELDRAHHRVQKQLSSAARLFSVSFRASSGALAHQLQSLLSNSVVSSPQGTITVYIKTSSRKGRAGNDFVVQQNVQIKVFDAIAPGVLVAQKMVTELGKSSTSLAAASDDAKQKLIKKLTNEPIYSILD